MRKTLVLTVIFLLLLSKETLAQQELLRSILFALMGRLPAVCEVDLTDPECIRCMMYVKIFPLLFYTSVFFLIFYSVISQMIPSPTPKTGLEVLALAGRQLTQPYSKVAALIAVILGLFFLHVEIAPRLGMWVQIALFVFSVLFARGVLKLGGVPLFAAGIIIWLALFLLFGALILPAVEQMQRVCILR
jgi:hypothetical protein